MQALTVRVSELSESFREHRGVQAEITRSTLEEHRVTLKDTREQVIAVEELQKRMDKIDNESLFEMDQRMAREEERRQQLFEDATSSIRECRDQGTIRLADMQRRVENIDNEKQDMNIANKIDMQKNLEDAVRKLDTELC